MNNNDNNQSLISDKLINSAFEDTVFTKYLILKIYKEILFRKNNKNCRLNKFELMD